MQTLAFCGRVALFMLLTLAALPWARADVFVPYIGARSMGMGGAHIGLNTSNDTLVLNPAGMSMSRRYAVDGGMAMGNDHINHVLVTAVDSKSGPVAAGVAYGRDWGNPSGSDAGINRIVAASSVALGQSLALGVSAQNLRGSYLEAGDKRDVSIYNGSIGLALNIANLFGAGIVYHNFVPVREARLAPTSLGLGASIKAHVFNLAADVNFDMRKDEKHRMTFGAGGEISLLRMLAVRAGYRLGTSDPTYVGPYVNYITFGAGLGLGSGSLQLAGQKALGAQSWQAAASLQFFV